MPSRPWLKANAQRDGFWTRDQDISLGVLVQVYSKGFQRERKKIPRLADILTDILWSTEEFETCVFGEIEVVCLCAEGWEEHAVFFIQSPLVGYLSQ